MKYLNKLKHLVEWDNSVISIQLKYRDERVENQYNNFHKLASFPSALLVEIIKCALELNITYNTFVRENDSAVGSLFLALSLINIMMVWVIFRFHHLNDLMKIIHTLIFQVIFLLTQIIKENSELSNTGCYFILTIYVILSVQHRINFFIYIFLQQLVWHLSLLVFKNQQDSNLVFELLFSVIMFFSFYQKQRNKLQLFQQEFRKSNDYTLQESILNVVQNCNVFIIRQNWHSDLSIKQQLNDKIGIEFANQACIKQFGDTEQILDEISKIHILNNGKIMQDYQASNYNLKVNVSWDFMIDRNFKGSTNDQLNQERQLNLYQLIQQLVNQTSAELYPLRVNGRLNTKLVDDVNENFDILIQQCYWLGHNSIIVSLYNLSDKQKIHNLEQQTQYKDNILATVSHDLKNPIGAIYQTIMHVFEQLSEMIPIIPKESALKFQEAIGFLEICLTNIQILQSFVNDLQDFSQIRKQKLKLNIITFSIKPILKEIQSVFHFQLQTKKIQFIFEDNIAQQECQNDPIRLKQILFNLVSNSLKFTQFGEICVQITDNFKQIQIFCRNVKQQILNNKSNVEIVNLLQNKYNLFLITVQDSGNGMDLLIQKGLFKLFSTFDNEKLQNKNGVGLGLIICKQLCGYIGPINYIYLESKIGSGSKFQFVIYKNHYQQKNNEDNQDDKHSVDSVDYDVQIQSPYRNISTPKHTPQNLFQIQKRCQLKEKNYKILLVDDEIFNNMTNKMILQKFEINDIDFAYNAQEAIKAIKNNHYDLIFLDVSLPDQSGIQCLKEIKKYNKNLRVFMLTAFTDLDTKLSSLEAGAEKILEKPLTIKQLQSIVL